LKIENQTRENGEKTRREKSACKLQMSLLSLKFSTFFITQFGIVGQLLLGVARFNGRK
jgi:hypothetical protein